MNKKKIISLVSLVVLGLIALIVGAFFAFNEVYRNRIYPGTKVGGVDLSGLSIDQAKTKLDQANQAINNQGLFFSYQDKQVIAPLASVDNIDLAEPMLSFDNDKSVLTAYAWGRSDASTSNRIMQELQLFFGKNFSPSYSLRKDLLENYLRNNYQELDNKMADAELQITISNEEVKTEIKPEREGEEIDYPSAIAKVEKNLNSFDNSTIYLQTIKKYPTILSKDCLNTDNQVKQLLNIAPINITYNTNISATSSIEIKKASSSTVIDRSVLVKWLSLKKENSGVVVIIDKDRVADYLKEKIAPLTDNDPNKASLEIVDGRVNNFQISLDGQKLDIEASVAKIIGEINFGNKNISLVVNKITAPEDEINQMNIQEIIGTGHSNFAGSPANRRHNIKTGIKTLQGAIIKPGEEFSLVKMLGSVDQKSGYLPELVIKDNKTTPEYGGGLCQVGTTLFRTALASGLPITERRNHSYRVGYYEPAGTDAAIYISHPDVRFVNDSNNYIVIQTRMEGNDLYFDFWGKKDGRVASTTKPTIYNIVKPAPGKTIETTDLPVGKKKCTEKAHAGADAYFDYIVTYPATATSSTETVVEKRFSSHYVPWQEVCLVGVDKLGASSTPAVGQSTGTTTPASPVN